MGSFSDTLKTFLNHGAAALMVSIGHRTGLFDAMADLWWATSGEIARASGLNERYVREWLGAMTAAGIVDHRTRDGAYRLPLEHAACLTREASPNNMAAFMQYISVLGSVEDEVVEAFRHGRGVPYSAYKRFHAVMAEESGQTVVAALLDQILPLVPRLRDRLAAGLDVMDVGCGSGRALIEMAAAFPASRFTGFDISDEALAAGRVEARRRGLTNVQLLWRDVSELAAEEEYDLVTAFDAIHEQAQPDRVLENIHRALRPGGVFLMQDIAASSHVHENVDHPAGPFLYTISCMHSMPVSHAAGGPGLGAMWGKETALQMLQEAGFQSVRTDRLQHDSQNFYYTAEKHR
ncbi:MAG TPA: methyltransferase domain-containing protein [Thermoanaerobaculia bacterium]|nr:methyltransferase domain-containing protein [Thermoanaerobaculia bacterium]